MTPISTSLVHRYHFRLIILQKIKSIISFNVIDHLPHANPFKSHYLHLLTDGTTQKYNRTLQLGFIQLINLYSLNTQVVLYILLWMKFGIGWISVCGNWPLSADKGTYLR